MKLDLQQKAVYEKRMAAHGETPEGVGWRDRKAQEIRFDRLLELISVRSGFSINDVGCGLGHLYEYMNENGFHGFRYRGVDLSSDMIERADRRHRGADAAEFIAVTRLSDMPTADFCLASGIFSYRGEASEAEWLGYVLQTMDQLNEKSVRGFGFNMLTRYSDPERMEPVLYYADPCFIFDFCKRNYSRNVALLHDYDEYDFTVVVRKASVESGGLPGPPAEKG